MGRIVRTVTAILLLVVVTPVQSSTADWTVTRIVGTVWVTTPGGEASLVTEGHVVPPGWALATGSGSRVMLVRGDDVLSLGENTIVAALGDVGQTTVAQYQGTVTYDVDHRPNRVFTVQTPVLAAVVKGTTFDVTVWSDESRVNLTEGSVEVTALTSGISTTLAPGQSAAVRTEVPGVLVTAASGVNSLAGTLPGGLEANTVVDAVEDVVETVVGVVGEAVQDIGGVLDDVEGGLGDVVDGLLGDDSGAGGLLGGITGGLGL